MGIDKWVKRQAHKAKKGIDHAANDTKKAFEDGGKAVKKTAEDAVKEINRMSNDLDKKFNQLNGKINNEFKDFERKLNSTKDKAVSDINKAGQKALSDISHSGKNLINNIEKEAKLITTKIDQKIESLPGTIKDTAITVFQEMTEAGIRKSIGIGYDLCLGLDSELKSFRNSKPRLVDAIDSQGFTLKLSVLTLKYTSFLSRSEQLIGALKNFKEKGFSFRRKPVLDMVEALGPDSINSGIGVQGALVFGTSNLLNFEASLEDTPLVLFTEIGDIILKKLGVPE